MAFTAIKTYVVNATTTASTPLNVPLPDGFGNPDPEVVRYLVYIDGGKACIKFGDSSVQADKTVTGNTLENGNFVLGDAFGIIYAAEKNQQYVSCQTFEGTADIYITVGLVD